MKLLKSLLKTFKHTFKADDEVQKLLKKYPRTTNFFKQRLDREKFTGLPLTILSIAFFYVLLLFLGVVEDFVASDIIVNVDIRTSTLLYAFRNPLVVKVFLWITLLGQSPTIIVFVLLTCLFLLLRRKLWQIIALLFTISGSNAFTFISKIIFHRPRPSNPVFLESSNSFPSGHATSAIAFYGFLTYLLVRKVKKKRYRILITLFGILVMLAIGFSRLYLGVHYVSDVWAGYLVGFLWLIVAISIMEWKMFKKPIIHWNKKFIKKYKKILSVSIIALAAVFYISFGLIYKPKYYQSVPATIQTTKTALNIFTYSNLPRYTETLTGANQEPISFVITAKDDKTFLSSFEKAGWQLADSLNYTTTMELAKSAILNKEYKTAPMTPSFWNKQVHTFGFEKSTETDSVRQRHHARFWKTNFKTQSGENIYVGTASLDVSIKWFITHKINPDIDTEREILFTDLQKIGAIKNYEKIKLVDPILGQNFSGDQFFTDGEAYITNF